MNSSSLSNSVVLVLPLKHLLFYLLYPDRCAASGFCVFQPLNFCGFLSCGSQCLLPAKTMTVTEVERDCKSEESLLVLPQYSNSSPAHKNESYPSSERTQRRERKNWRLFPDTISPIQHPLDWSKTEPEEGGSGTIRISGSPLPFNNFKERLGEIDQAHARMNQLGLLLNQCHSSDLCMNSVN